MDSTSVIEIRTKAEKFVDKNKRDIIYCVVIVVLTITLHNIFSSKNVAIEENTKLKNEVANIESVYKEKIIEIEDKYKKENEAIISEYNTRINTSKTKYEKTISNLKIKKMEKLKNANTPDKKVRLGLDLIDGYNARNK